MKKKNYVEIWKWFGQFFFNFWALLRYERE